MEDVKEISEQGPPAAPRPSTIRPLRPGAVLRAADPLHRRRRLTALTVVAGIALVIGIAAGAIGSSGHRASPAPALEPGFFGRIRTLAGTGAGSLAIEEKAEENAAIEKTLAYTPYVRIAGAQHREVALTFDDGPGPYTPRILSELRVAHAPATFFEVGVEEQYFHASTMEILAMGDAIGDHTETHAPMSKLSKRDQRAELLQATAAIGNWGAPFPRLFRPPYGDWNNATLKLLRNYGMLMVLWTVDTGDYRQPGVKAIVRAAVDGAKPGAIILLHDAGGNRSETVAALPRIISALRRRGYKLVTVPRLLLDNPAPHDQQITAAELGGGG
jgi:peptidoglycan/xylan/chitin deacetylase (PgdA/CDA1 family)